MSMPINDTPYGGSPERFRTVHYRHVFYEYAEMGGVEYLVGVRYVDQVAYGRDAYSPPPTDD